MKFAIYIQGYNEDYDIIDYGEEVAVFTEQKVAEWFISNYEFSIPQSIPHANAVIEELNDNNEFVDIVAEYDIK